MARYENDPNLADVKTELIGKIHEVSSGVAKVATDQKQIFKYIDKTRADLVDLIDKVKNAMLVEIAQLETKVESLEAEMLARFAQLEAEMAEMLARIAQLESEFEAFKTEMRAEFEAFKTEMRAEFEAFKTEMRAEFAAFKGEVVERFDGVEGALVLIADALNIGDAVRTQLAQQ